ncbi:MAG: ADP-glyceromanno-heptose 6-epimerase, partial [Smithellaceae bacterium]|nr:ADP-glyceromanno-heptose 6-epimerase [Smithellaceae bacterium]
LVNRAYVDYLHKDHFLDLIKRDALPFPVETLVHLGACSSTTERDADYLMENNYRYSCHLATWAAKRQVRFIYASSAATYGDGSRGFSDNDGETRRLRPINMYGYSKQLFDLWLLRQGLASTMAGVKFFNVFGPNEYHKGDMTSVIYKAFHQICEEGVVRLFKSYLSSYGDGEQRRDFIYVKDCVDVLLWLIDHPGVNGIYNLGTGQSRTWNDLVTAVFAAIKGTPRIEYIDMPPSLRNQYQYFTEAPMEKLRAQGYSPVFHSLEEAIEDYVVNYLERPDPYL